MSATANQNVTAAVLDFRRKFCTYLLANDDQNGLELAEAEMQNPELAVEATCALAAIYYRAGALGYAIKLLSTVVDQGDYPGDVPEVLAVLYCRVGCLSDALYHAKLSTTEVAPAGITVYFGSDFPLFPDAFANIGSKPLLASCKALLAAGSLDRAQFLIEQHLCILPNDVEALDCYAQIQIRQGNIGNAIGMLRSVATLAGPSATLLSRMAHCLILTGQFQEGLACHHEAVARAPTALPILGAAVSDLQYFDVAEAASTGIPQSWITQLAASGPKTVRPPPKYTGASPLRICYLCSSLDSEELRSMVGAIAKSHDRSRFTVLGFGTGDSDSPQNGWTRGAFQLWRDVSSLDVTTMGALLRGEGVHVVIDADGLRVPARSGLFQRNAAPLQVSWLHGSVSGRVPGNYLSCVPHVAEVGQMELQTGRYCLSDPAGSPPVATPAPAEAGGNITFGAELSMAELSPRLAMVWGRILQAVPGSVLLFRDSGMLSEPDAVERLLGIFGNAGVAHRIDVIKDVSRADFAACIDVALMPFPSANVLAYGEFLRNGAPVVAATHCDGGADMGAFLTAAGLGDALVSADVNGYVARATALAGNVAGLSQLRRSLPASLSSVPSFSAKGFAQMIEAAIAAELEKIQA